jgi:hypothetical protein
MEDWLRAILFESDFAARARVFGEFMPVIFLFCSFCSLLLSCNLFYSGSVNVSSPYGGLGALPSAAGAKPLLIAHS